MRKKSKALVAAMCALVLALGVNATYAYLTDTTKAVTNTFTVGNVDITLTETDAADNNEDGVLENAYKMIPGNTIAKDPKVTVLANSEACWLFVKVEESSTLDTFIDYSVIGGEQGWKALGEAYPDVYYREVAAADADVSFSVIEGPDGTDNQVKVKTTVTKTNMDVLNVAGATQPTLTFTAYAVQKAGFDNPAVAWVEANK